MNDAPINAVTLDLDRQRRCGFPEVVFGEGKTAETMAAIFTRLLSEGMPVLATRVTPEKAAILQQHFSDGRYNATARTFRISVGKQPHLDRVAVVTAGTSDLPV